MANQTFPGSNAVTINIGKGIEMVLDVDRLPSNGLAHAVRIGLRNILMDSHASITAEEYPDESARKAAALAMAEKKWTALCNGEVRVGRTFAPRGDTIESIMRKHAKAAVIKWGNAKAKATLPNADDKTRTQWVNDGFDGWMTAYMAAKADELRAIAEAELAAKAKLGTVDLDDLLA